MKAVVAEAISEYLNNHKHADIEVSECSCGAMTMINFKNSESISFKKENAPYISATSDGLLHNCNHCANDWGVDVEFEEEELEEE